jgi:hypothetical protein
MDPGNLDNPDLRQFQQFLQGVKLPTPKEEVASNTESNGASQDVVQQIRAAAPERFDGAEEVMQAARAPSCRSLEKVIGLGAPVLAPGRVPPGCDDRSVLPSDLLASLTVPCFQQFPEFPHLGPQFGDASFDQGSNALLDAVEPRFVLGPPEILVGSGRILPAQFLQHLPHALGETRVGVASRHTAEQTLEPTPE